MDDVWTEFAPFLDYSPKMRRVIYSTNAIESLHARFRRATRARGHFPNEQADLKCLYLVVRRPDPTGEDDTPHMTVMTLWLSSDHQVLTRCRHHAEPSGDP